MPRNHHTFTPKPTWNFWNHSPQSTIQGLSFSIEPSHHHWNRHRKVRILQVKGKWQRSRRNCSKINKSKSKVRDSHHRSNSRTHMVVISPSFRTILVSIFRRRCCKRARPGPFCNNPVNKLSCRNRSSCHQLLRILQPTAASARKCLRYSNSQQLRPRINWSPLILSYHNSISLKRLRNQKF